MSWSRFNPFQSRKIFICGYSRKIHHFILPVFIIAAFGIGSSGVVTAAFANLPEVIDNQVVTINSGDIPGTIDYNVTIQNHGSLIINTGADLTFDHQDDAVNGANTRVSIRVKSTGSLTVKSGVNLTFGTDNRIIVESGGSMTLGETVGAPTLLIPLNALFGWYGLRNEGGNITLNQCDISGAEYGVFQDGGESVVDHSSLENCNFGIQANTGQVTLSNNVFVNTNKGTAVDLRGVLVGTSLISGNEFQDYNRSINLDNQNSVTIRDNIFKDGPNNITIEMGSHFNNSSLSIYHNNFICSAATKNANFYFIENLAGTPTGANIVTIYNSYWKGGGNVYTKEVDIKNALLVDRNDNVFLKGFLDAPIGAPDTHPPVLEEVSPTKSQAGTVYLGVIISDDISGVDPNSVAITVKNTQNNTPYAATISSVKYNLRQYTFEAVVSLPIGTYTWEVSAKDFANNAMNSTSSQQLSVVNSVDTVSLTPNNWINGSYFMVTVPINANVLDHRVALGLTAPDSGVAMYQNIGGNNQYVYYGDQGLEPIVPGRGFWLKLGGTESSTATRNITGIIPPVVNGVVKTPDEVKNLTPGWHIIGSPVANQPVNINQLSFTYPKNGNPTFTGRLIDAVNDGVVSFGFWGYTRNTSGGNSYYLERTQLNPWEGYWLHVKQNCSMEYHTTQFLPSGASVMSWEIQLTASQGGNSDGANYLGLTQASTSGVDKMDLEKPPAMGNTIQAFLTPQGASTEYGVDLRSGNSRREQWRFTVNGLEPGAATISWRGLTAVPFRYKLTLYDLTTGRQVDLKNTTAYQFTVGTETTRQFEVIMADLGSQAMSISGLGLSQNPFAPLRESVTVSYTLSSDAVVDTRIYDWVGNLVYIYPSANNLAGPNSFVWDGRNNLGRMAANGIYFCKISARNGTGQTTQILKIAVVN